MTVATSLSFISVSICARNWFISFCCSVCVETIDPSFVCSTISASLANVTASWMFVGFFNKQ